MLGKIYKFNKDNQLLSVHPSSSSIPTPSFAYCGLFYAVRRGRNTFEKKDGTLFECTSREIYVKLVDWEDFLEMVPEKINNNKDMNNKNLMNEVLEKIYEDKELRSKVVPCFMSDPGLNKSTTIREFAKKKGVKLLPLVLSQRNPNEISGVLMPDKGEMKYFDYDLLKTLKKGDILFLDEVLNSPPMVLNACLTILMERELVSGYKLPDIMIVAASNPQGATRLTPQQKQRFLFYDLSLDVTSFKNYLKKKYQLPSAILSHIISIINAEKFDNSTFNYSSARSIDTAIDMLIKNIPTPYEKILKPSLDLLQTNKLGDIELSDGTVFLKGEMKSWLTLKRLNHAINTK